MVVIKQYYQHVVASGLPYDRGFQYGQQVQEKIQRNVANYKTPGKLLPLEECYQIISDVYIPGCEKFCPDLLKEIRGVADGADVPFLDIMLLNSRYDLARVESPSANECTSAAFLPTETDNGDMIVAQNWDMDSMLMFDDLVVYLEIHTDPSEGLPAKIFVTTEAGQLGRSGMNSEGLGVCANSLMSTEDYYPIDARSGKPQKPLVPMSMLRRIFLEQSLFGKALMSVVSLPRHVSNNLTVATADGYGMCLELTPSDMFIVYPDKTREFVAHANHFDSLGFHASGYKDRYPGPSSWYRSKQLERRILALPQKSLNQKSISQAFCDHLSRPLSLCQHPADSDVKNAPKHAYNGSNATIAHVVYNLSEKIATVCKGPPCEGSYYSYNVS